MTPPKSHIVALTGGDGTPHVVERFEAFRRALHASGVSLALSTFEDAELFSRALAHKRKGFDALYLGASEKVDVGTVLTQLAPRVPCVTFHLTDAAEKFLASGQISAVIDPSRYYQAYIAVQTAYECLQSQHADRVEIPCAVVLRSHLSGGNGKGLNSMFEMLVRQRTKQLRNYRDALERANAQLMLISDVDPVTGTWNRRRWEQAVADEMRRATTQEPLTLVMATVDNFPELDGMLGRAAGEQALRFMADLLRSASRLSDLVARTGEAEFSLILPGTGSDAAEAIRQRLLEQVKSRRGANDTEIRASMAVVPFTAKHLTAADLIAEATNALSRPLPGAGVSQSLRVM